MSDNKPSGPFRAEDFAGAVVFGCDSADHCADAANARLAPLWEALERHDVAVRRVLKSNGDEEDVAECAEASADIVTAYRALRDREGK